MWPDKTNATLKKQATFGDTHWHHWPRKHRLLKTHHKPGLNSDHTLGHSSPKPKQAGSPQMLSITTSIKCQA